MNPSLPAAPRARKLALRHEAALLILLLALLAWARVSTPEFVTLQTQRELLTHGWELGLVCVPMTLIILSGGIDLSVGSTMALSAVTFGLAFERHVPPPAAALLALVVGTAAGALNGFFVARVKVHPLLVTLATLAAFRGLAEGISGARPISGFPAGFSSALADPTPAILFAILAGAGIWFLNRSPGGVWLRAIGFNETGARFSGVPVERMKMWLYTLSGSTCALAAVLYVARRNTAKADIATGLELDAVTAVVLGGTSIFGGRGHIVGTILGLALIHETREWLSWRFDRSELNLLVLGALLIASVGLQRVLGNKD